MSPNGNSMLSEFLVFLTPVVERLDGGDEWRLAKLEAEALEELELDFCIARVHEVFEEGVVKVAGALLEFPGLGE